MTLSIAIILGIAIIIGLLEMDIEKVLTYDGTQKNI